MGDRPNRSSKDDRIRSYRDLAVWQEAMELNFHAARRITHALVPAMQAQGFGRIIVVLADLGNLFVGNPGTLQVRREADVTRGTGHFRIAIFQQGQRPQVVIQRFGVI